MLATITVNSLDDNSVGDGFVTLREAIQAANQNISVDGSVAGTGNDTIVFDSALSGQPILLFAELEITEPLTIDATALASGITIDALENGRVFNITASAGDFELSGLTLINGRTTGDDGFGPNTTYSGGAIRSVTTGTLTLNQTDVRDSFTTGERARGGGIFAIGDVVLRKSTVSGNYTVDSNSLGAGVYSDTTVSLFDSSVSNNHTRGFGAAGGGIFAVDVSLSNSAVSGNFTEGFSARGGGIATFGTVTLTNSSVSDNHTRDDDSDGGGISASGDVTLDASRVDGNRTLGESSLGGGIASRASVILRSSFVEDNFTQSQYSAGGGVFAIDAVGLNESVVSGNRTEGNNASGGGIVAADGDVILIRRQEFSSATVILAKLPFRLRGNFW